MKASIIFSSLTGNTKKLAYEILEAMPIATNIYDLKYLGSHGENLEADVLILGYWVDKAKPNKQMYEFMEKIGGKKIITFGTMGAYPDSPHGDETKNNVMKILQEKNQVLGNFLCQGKIDPKITQMFMRNKDANNVHTMTPERMKKHQDVASHPNEEDFNRARNFVRNIIENL